MPGRTPPDQIQVMCELVRAQLPLGHRSPRSKGHTTNVSMLLTCHLQDIVYRTGLWIFAYMTGYPTIYCLKFFPDNEERRVSKFRLGMGVSTATALQKLFVISVWCCL